MSRPIPSRISGSSDLGNFPRNASTAAKAAARLPRATLIKATTLGSKAGLAGAAAAAGAGSGGRGGRNGGGGGGQLRVDVGIGGGGFLGDVLFHNAGEFLVGRPERLPEADRAGHDLGDRGVIIAPVAIVKNAVAPDHEIVVVALGNDGHDLEAFAGSFARAFAVGEEGAGKSGHDRVLGGVLDAQAEAARAPVPDKGRRLGRWLCWIRRKDP